MNEHVALFLQCKTFAFGVPTYSAARKLALLQRVVLLKTFQSQGQLCFLKFVLLK